MSTSKRATLADIAASLGISTATVSRSLSGRGYVSEAVTRDIQRRARELGYPVPEAPIGNRVMVIASNAALLDLQRNQFTLHVLDGLKGRAQELGIEVELVSSDNHDAVFAKLDARFPDLIGVILLTVDQAVIAHARPFAQHLPVILLNDDDPKMKIDSISPCNRSASALAASHLTALGHQRILFMGKMGRRTIARRLEGMRDVMGDALRDVDILSVADWTLEDARAAVSKRLGQGQDFTAIVAAADILAVGAIMAVQDAGLRVPEDISVVGIDGLPQGALLSPPLTTVALPMPQIGMEALDMVCDSARQRKLGKTVLPRRVELACTLIERGSSATESS